MKDVQTDLVFTALPTDYVTRLWPQIVKVLEKSIATTDGRYTTDDVYNRIMDEELVVWVVLDPTNDDEIIAAITTRLIRYPNQHAMAMDFVGGTRMSEWFPVAHDKILRYAKDHNCWHMEGYGRKGWSRFLKKYDWLADYTVYKVNIREELTRVEVD